DASGAILSMRLTAGDPRKPDVLRNVQLEIRQGEIFGLVGRSGGGESTLILSIFGLLGLKGGNTHGEILFRGRNLMKLSDRGIRGLRGRQVALVPQSPLTALNPHLRLGEQLNEAWRAHQPGKPDAKPLLESVSLPSDAAFLRLHPRNLSVG